jgi:hypothetical protein
MQITQHMDGTALKAMSGETVVGTAKKTPCGWQVRCRLGTPWNATFEEYQTMSLLSGNCSGKD